MKRKIYLWFVFMLLPHFVFSERLTESELLHLLGTQQGEGRLSTLYDLQQIFLYEPEDWHYNELLLREAQKQNNIPYVSLALRNRVAYYYRKFNSDSIFYYANIAENFALEHDQKRDWFLVKQIVIQRYLEQGCFSLGLKEAMKMSKTAQGSNNPQMEATAMEFLAKTYQSLNKPQEAIDYMKRARNELFSRKDTPYKALGYYLFMSNLYEDKKDKDSIYLYADSLRLAIHEIKENHPTYNLKDYEIGSSLSLTCFYIHDKQFDKAWSQIEMTDSLIEEKECQYFVFLSNLKKMQLFYAKKDYEKMNYYYDLSYNYCRENRLERGVRHLLRLKAIALGEQGEHDGAVRGYKEMEAHIDSVNNERFLYEVNQLGMEFELDKKDDFIKQQERELKLKTQLNLVLITLFILSFIAVVIITKYLKIIKGKNKHLFSRIKELTSAKLELLQFKECVRDRVGGLTTDCSGKDNVLFERVEEFMNKEKPYVDSEYGRKNLIMDMNTNEVYLSRAIKKGINMTIQEYINSWRLECAKNILLKDTNLTIEIVAMDAGFSSIRSFYRLFKDAYGMSPAEFRNYVRENYKT